MTIAELIEALQQWPDQDARVVYSFASETDGCECLEEVSELKSRIAWDTHGALGTSGTTQLNVLELI